MVLEYGVATQHYDDAVARLEPVCAEAWAEAAKRLAEVLPAVESEHHLPQLIEFLTALAHADWSRSDVQQAYRDACVPFVLRGPAAEVDAAWLIHYRNRGESLIKRLAQESLKATDIEASHELHRLKAEAEREDSARTWQDLLAWLADHWGELTVKDRVAVTGWGACFVTFDLDTPLERDSAEAMRRLHALGPQKGRVMLELRFDRRADDQLRLPTCADAHWNALFRSAPPGSRHGWTAPADPVDPPQPEVVMPTPTLARLRSPAGLRTLL